MKKSLFLFFCFLVLYITFLFLGDFEINFSSFFLWNILRNKIWIFIILWIGIFLSGKEVIDKSDDIKKEFYLNQVWKLFIFFLVVLSINNIFGENITSSFLSNLSNIINGIFILTVISWWTILYLNKNNFLDYKILDYKDKKIYYVILWIIIILGFLIRFYKLWDIQPFDDEYTHIANAKRLYENVFIEDDRFMLLNYLLKFFYDIFGYNIYNFWTNDFQWLILSRLPSVIVSVAIIFTFFKIWTHLVSEKFWIILALIFSISPISIEMWKFIREYIYVFLVFSLVVYTSIKAKTKKQIMMLYWLFIFIILYAVFLEPFMTLKIIIFFIFAYTLAKFYWNWKNILWKYNKYLIISIWIFLWLLWSLFVYYFKHNIWINVNFQWLDFFVFNTKYYSNWLNNLFLLPFVFVIISFIYIKKEKDKKEMYYFLLILLVSFIIYYTFLFPRYLQIRYWYYAYLPLYVFLWYGFYYVYIYILRQNLLWWVLLFFAVFNLNSVWYSMNWYEIKTWNKITWHYIEDYKSIYEDLNLKIKKEDIVIASIPNAYYTRFNIDQDKLFKYYYLDEERFNLVNYLVKNNPQGYIIADWRRNWYWSPWLWKKDFYIDDIKVQYVWDIKSTDIFRWKY